MPKLVQINVASNCGSTGRIAEQIGGLVKAKGWESYIVHAQRYSRPTALADISTSYSLAEKTHYLGSLLTDGQGLFSQNATKQLVRKLEQIKPDIVHLHNIHGSFMNFPILFEYLKRVGVPIVWTLHDCWSFTGHCTYFDRIGCERWLSGCGKCSQKREYPQSIVDRSSWNYELKKKIFTSSSNLTMVPVSDWLHKLVAQSFMGKYPIKTIHNGIDLDKFKHSNSDFRQRYGIAGKFVVLGVADGFGRRKGLNDFNELSERLGNDVRIVMVGLNNDDKKQISPGIIGMGRTANQQELIDIYSAADVFINPTYEDNFPTTNIEALACGTPVITYRTGGSPEAVDEYTGIVVDKGDVEGMMTAILKIKELGRNHYSKHCRERAERCFNKDDRFEEYVRLYESLIERR